MSKLHAINGGGHQVDEIMVGEIKYIRADKVKTDVGESSVKIDYEKLGIAIGLGVAQALGNVTSINSSAPSLEKPTTIPKGLNKLPDEKKGSELSAMLYGKLPGKLRHPARFRTFYTDFERDTGIGLYSFHKERIRELEDGTDVSQYPYRKADSIFMIAGEDIVFDYVNKYEFTFDK